MNWTIDINIIALLVMAGILYGSLVLADVWQIVERQVKHR